MLNIVGPDFGRTPDAFNELYLAYYYSLVVLKDNNLHSIAFPLISSGIYGGNLDNPVRESTKCCIKAYNKFISDYPEYDIDVRLYAYSSDEYEEAKNNYCKYKRTTNNSSFIFADTFVR